MKNDEDVPSFFFDDERAARETAKQQAIKAEEQRKMAKFEVIKPGDTVVVLGDLITVITRIEGDKYYFKDEAGKEWQEDRASMEKIYDGSVIQEDMRSQLDSYYGVLTTFEGFVEDDGLDFTTISRDAAIGFMNNMLECGVKQILLDVDDDHADTLFFRIDESTNLGDLMVIIHGYCPDELSRQSDKNWFRLWWD